MYTPTAAEREAFLWMQGRMIELLMRHDPDRFGKTFTNRAGDPAQLEDAAHALLRRQRDLAVFFYLRDELFDNILPRIKRRLSFVAPHTVRREDLPPRGRIDWARTAAQSLRDRPGAAPLSVVTRQRRRHFATPENLLTVATLLEYREASQALLDAEIAGSSVAAIRHPLHDIVESATRELVFPQFAGLIHQAQAVLNGQGSETVEDMEAAVAENLQPGSNSAYDDLLAWRRQLHSLRLLERTADAVLQPMLGSDPARDNYLYQTWLFYELAALLQQQGRLREWDIEKMVLTYTWGEEASACQYRLQHDRAIPVNPAHAGSKAVEYWKSGPGVRPDFYISRPDRQEVRDSHGILLWHDPGYILDAKYYRPSDSDKAPNGPIKRMIADLELTGERLGTLLFAFHGVDPADPPPALEDKEAAEQWAAASAATQVYPWPERAQRVPPDLRITAHRIQPGFASAALLITLTAVLAAAHDALSERVPIHCHGVFLDSLTATAHRTLAAAPDRRRDGKAWAALPSGTPALDDLLVCPKPHVGAWRIDLVSHTHDCCQNASVCHILALKDPALRKPERLNMLEAVTAAIEEAAGGDSDPDGSAHRAAEYVRTIGKRYAKLLNQDLGHYGQKVAKQLDIGELYQTTSLLNTHHRETLALARFLWEQIEAIGADNFAAPTLLFTGVLEEITQATIYQVQDPPLTDSRGKELQKTLGTLGNCKGWGGINWRLLDHTINDSGYWNPQLDEGITLPFEKWINNVQSIVETRNNAAHHANAKRQEFDKLITTLFGSARTGMGLLNGILLAWVNPPASPT